MIAPPPLLRRVLTVAASAFPAVVWFNDSVYSTARVSGDSMSPALLDGDVLLIRRSDVLPGGDVSSAPIDVRRRDERVRDRDRERERRVESPIYSSEEGDELEDDDDDDVAGGESSVECGDDGRARRPFRWESPPRDLLLRPPFLSSPPSALPGDVVTLRDPRGDPSPLLRPTLLVKRVIAVGGQRVRVPVPVPPR